LNPVLNTVADRDTTAYFEFVRDSVVKVYPEIVALEPGSNNRSLLIEIVSTCIKLGFVITTLRADIMRIDGGSSENFILPVGVDI